MNDKLINQMSHDMNIYKFSDESREHFYQRLIYSAGVEWMKTLVYGDSYADIGIETTFTGVDIMYISSHLTDVLVGIMSIIDVENLWFDDSEMTVKEKAGKLTSQIIKDVLFTHNLAVVNSRRIIPLDNDFYKYGKNAYLIRGSIPFDDNVFNVGPAKWSQVCSVDYKEDNRIINVPASKYYSMLLMQVPWQQRSLSSHYHKFKVGTKGGYSKSWIPCAVDDIPSKLSILKLDDKFNGGYFLTKRKNGILYVFNLDSWYIKSKEIYRIYYSLNFANHTPAEFKVKIYDDYYELYYSSTLPDYENRLIYNCSWPSRRYDDKYVRIIPRCLWNIVEEALNFLGIEITIYKNERNP